MMSPALSNPALTSPALSDPTLQTARAPSPIPIANATIVERQDLTTAVARFLVRPDDGPTSFKPGQYLALGLEIYGRFVQRPYSSAAAGGSRDHEFLIRHVAGGEFTPHLWRLGVGARVRLGRPKGIFTLLEDDHRTHVFVATGTGLAPFMSMLHALRARTDAPRSLVLHGVAAVAELAYRDRLEGRASGGLGYVPVVSRPGAQGPDGWTGRTGHVGEALHDLFVRGTLEAESVVAYLCGNPAMIASVTRVLADAGVAPEAIRSEQYWVDPMAQGRDNSAA